MMPVSRPYSSHFLWGTWLWSRYAFICLKVSMSTWSLVQVSCSFLPKELVTDMPDMASMGACPDHE
eukprot:CAMPEP_0170511554 /NCGR_PEP_ID=MMETSP0208-20121228/66371_1 /TAXON_ID=197538 /ORGANISM="Strombidium inclinatum, Strain S3" /LENGTH=65 /DNA_ID=CAMNT_0010795109 /DNA_START=54 /DNA_END=251 /DNA_ORIENTATION=+